MPNGMYSVHVVNDNVEEPHQCELLLKVHKDYILNVHEQKGLQKFVNQLASDFNTHCKAVVTSNTGYEYTITTDDCQWIFRIYDSSKWCVFIYLRRIALEYCKLYNQLTWIEKYVTYLVFLIVKINQLWFFEEDQTIFDNLANQLTSEVLYGELPTSSDKGNNLDYENSFQISTKHRYNHHFVSNHRGEPFECEFYFRVPNDYVFDLDEISGIQKLTNALARINWNGKSVLRTGTKYIFAMKQFQLAFNIYDYETEPLYPKMFSSKLSLVCHIRNVALGYCKVYNKLTWMEKYATYVLLFIVKVYSNELLNPYGNVFGELVDKMKSDLQKEH